MRKFAASGTRILKQITQWQCQWFQTSSCNNSSQICACFRPRCNSGTVRGLTFSAQLSTASGLCSFKSNLSVTPRSTAQTNLQVHTFIYQDNHKSKVMTTAKKAKMSGDSMPNVNANGQDSDRLVWVDLEMTGLDIDTCHIIEAACLITDGQLNVIAEGPNIVIHQSDEIMDNMNSWCKDHHGKSGLTEQVRKSKVTLQQAEMELLSFVRIHIPRGRCPLAGNSIHADKKFLDKYMPQFMAHLHYRIVDVSTVKELCRRWYPSEYEKAPRKAGSHRALDDIRESIKELHYYREALFKQHVENDTLSNTES